MRQLKVGVFDSGIGGLSVAMAIKEALPDAEIIFKNDAEHVPYGTKLPAELFGYVVPIFEELIKDGCSAIVIACNTVSTTLIDKLRDRFSVPLIGMEPMIKPAASLTESSVIAVCATPTTLASTRYQKLKAQYAAGVTVLEPDCSGWAAMIEEQAVDQAEIETCINQVLDAGADVIVLGCTHYHWIEEDILALAAGRARVIQPEPAVIDRLKHLLTAEQASS